MKQSGIVQFAFLNPSWPRPRSSVCLVCVIGRKHTGDFFLRVCKLNVSMSFWFCSVLRVIFAPRMDSIRIHLCVYSPLGSSLTSANCFRNKQVRGQWPRCQWSCAGTGVWKTPASALEKRAKHQTARGAKTATLSIKEMSPPVASSGWGV